MGNLCRPSENRPETKTTKTTVPTSTTDPTEPSSKLEKNALRAYPSQVPEIDSTFDMDKVENNENVKLVVVGEADVGKTCAIHAYMYDRFVTKKGKMPPTLSRGDTYRETK